MLSSLMSFVVLFFFVGVAMVACALLGSLLFDLLPVLRDGDRRVRHPLVFPEIADRPTVRQPATVHRIVSAPIIPARIIPAGRPSVRFAGLSAAA
ncbi:hypothetical protein EKN06_12295 [Croceicoccus ponticola]|uniref:Uncharacterized protein n=2 Tax=Croceicoccus ponticola TaxID=2217664 RepID=A0A437GVE6_9SPHN|nr:hypothetical protein EKN06_12295 [Croceicoccus ponticola]